MITVCHGAFDHQTDPDCPISRLVRELRALNLTQVAEHECDEPAGLPPPDRLHLNIGYSNGAAWTNNVLWLPGHPPSHVIYIDGVRYGGGFLASPFEMPSNVLGSINLLRSKSPESPPWHQNILGVSPVLIPAGHGDIPDHPLVRGLIFELVQTLFGSPK